MNGEGSINRRRWQTTTTNKEAGEGDEGRGSSRPRLREGEKERERYVCVCRAHAGSKTPHSYNHKITVYKAGGRREGRGGGREGRREGGPTRRAGRSIHKVSSGEELVWRWLANGRLAWLPAWLAGWSAGGWTGALDDIKGPRRVLAGRDGIGGAGTGRNGSACQGEEERGRGWWG